MTTSAAVCGMTRVTVMVMMVVLLTLTLFMDAKGRHDETMLPHQDNGLENSETSETDIDAASTGGLDVTSSVPPASGRDPARTHTTKSAPNLNLFFRILAEVGECINSAIDKSFLPKAFQFDVRSQIKEESKPSRPLENDEESLSPSIHHVSYDILLPKTTTTEYVNEKDLTAKLDDREYVNEKDLTAKLDDREYANEKDLTAKFDDREYANEKDAVEKSDDREYANEKDLTAMFDDREYANEKDAVAKSDDREYANGKDAVAKFDDREYANEKDAVAKSDDREYSNEKDPVAKLDDHGIAKLTAMTGAVVKRSVDDDDNDIATPAMPTTTFPPPHNVAESPLPSTGKDTGSIENLLNALSTPDSVVVSVATVATIVTVVFVVCRCRHRRSAAQVPAPQNMPMQVLRP